MPNNDRTQLDAVWIDGYAPPTSDYEDLERKIFGSWNGDRGGAYCAPAVGGSAHIINGSGLQVTGPTRLTYGGAIYGGASAFVIRDGTWPELASGHVGRTRAIVQPIHTFFTSKRYLWSRLHAYAGVGSVALSCRTTYGRTIETADLYVPLRVIDGATMTKVALHFRVATKRIYAPLAMPKIRIMRVPRDGVAASPAPLKGTSDGLGFASPTRVTSGEAWYLDGAAQTFEYVCDQNNVIDVENYSYVAHIIEEVGALSPEDPFDGIRFVERKADVVFVGLSTATLNGGVLCDGSSSGTSGDRILIVDPDSVLDTGLSDTNSAKNGIWLTAVGAWTRASDLDDQSDFTPNWIVKATNGATNASATWQCQHPASNSHVELSSGAASGTATQPRIVPAQPKGNIYHSLVPTFALVDLRHQ